MSWGANVVEDDDDIYYSEDEGEDDILEPKLKDDSDPDIDADLTHAHGPSTSDEKRRAQNEIFRAFASKKAEDITEQDVKDAIQDADDELLSIRDILAKQKTSAQITNPRDYQTELFQRAKEENIIAVLDTGSGKTHIATLLLRHILDDELEQRAKGAPQKIAFFLVDSVNLVFQQANVLRCGLDHNVEGICGAMGAHLWVKQTWEKLFANNMVVVCTAEVLVQCMMHSFITVPRVNLLIFDEAHHAKNNHPYARLMKDYYLSEPDVAKRPRIFGMTASPVDANVDIKQAAQSLEALLHCKIATASDLALLANNISRPTEEVAKYTRLKCSFETSLHAELKSRYGDIAAFKKLFENSKIIGSELGRWPADMYWSFAFSEEEAKKIEMREERKFHKLKNEDSISKLDEEIARVREAAEFVRHHEFGKPSPTAQDLSPKVLLLYDWLNLYYSRTAEARCIVFVERRSTARLLNLIFSEIGGSNLHSDMLVGVNSTFGDLNISLRSQVMTVARFRRGDLNCLFSTSVAEEGLDIPQCNLIVRFDLYKTMIAYVQSRGRARHRNSKYLHMVEEGNSSHYSTVLQTRTAEKVMRDFCNGLPSDRCVNEINDEVEQFLASERSFRNYTVPESGARLTYRTSLSVLAHFVASLPAPNMEVCLQPTYIVERVGGKFICEVVLPEYSPIISARGIAYSKKAIAKCSAAFEMCLKLRGEALLDENLLPTYTKQLPAMRNALLAISSKKKDLYTMRVKPKFWGLEYGTVPKCLYLTVVDVSAGLDRPHQPLGLLTRDYFPQMPPFPLYLNDGRPTQVLSTPMVTAIPISMETIELLTKLTLQVFKDVFAKEFEKDITKMTYWVVPIRSEMTTSINCNSEKPRDLIDWDQIHEVVEEKEYRWTPEMPDEFLADKYIVDNWDGGRRFYTISVVPGVKPHDPVPNFSPRHKFMADILDYSVSLWTKSRVKCVWDESQPVMEVEKIPFRRNLLALVETDEDEVRLNLKAYVCPQPLRISALTTRFVAMCYAFPAIIHRFDDFLIAIDACHLLGLDIGPSLALEALTKDSENTDEHGEEKINFKSGMGPNYERLEFMGDCFLKMATSISTFVQQPDENEFEFHVRRMVMLCNKNLFKAAGKYKLYEYVRTMAFSRRLWYPEGLKLTKGKGAKKNGPRVIKHSLGDKSVADVCEAFIGAAFMEHNELGRFDPKNWDQAVKAVKVLVDSEDHLMEKYSDYYAAYEKPKYQLAEATASQMDLAKRIEEKHPYHFRYPRLLRSAFIHPSQAFMWENIPNYQRLEFLGDSLLDMVFIQYLFYRYTDKDPQWLTEHKMPMVSNKFLGALCVSLGFHTHIRQNNAVLTSQIRDYVTEVQEAEREAKGSLDYWTTVSEPPKCLADVVEAYVAAIYVDAEFDFTVVQQFFDMHIKRFFINMHLYDAFANSHPTTRLTKLLNTNFGCREWRIATRTCEATIPGARPTVIAMVQIHWKIVFDGSAVSGRYARIKASNAALEKLEGLPQYKFKKRYECDCEDEMMDESAEKVEERVKEEMGLVV
ncbi:dicer-like protein-like protein 1 [Lindgomyces ingoldianus]|uniref:Dicer-like protein-like protein 1 n=1 Tax=Lindgomyces ingoldianus TaxID=673940 RepID=A0ACB6R6I7_9PLEO|nr:dicer-like protein-like protein 1 [Lindgomyces ingoldianus]KAF2473917.1 dicer-like protein-like protein 1 [Lindgomyces ingoldianus]